MEYAEFSWSRAISATISLLKHICPEAFENLAFCVCSIYQTFWRKKLAGKNWVVWNGYMGLKPEEHWFKNTWYSIPSGYVKHAKSLAKATGQCMGMVVSFSSFTVNVGVVIATCFNFMHWEIWKSIWLNHGHVFTMYDHGIYMFWIYPSATVHPNQTSQMAKTAVP